MKLCEQIKYSVQFRSNSKLFGNSRNFCPIFRSV